MFVFVMGCVVVALARAELPNRGSGHRDYGFRRVQGLSRGDYLAACQSLVQICIVHVLRDSIRFAAWKECRPVAMAPNRSTKSKRPRRRESGWKI
jgi:hypothetical protein